MWVNMGNSIILSRLRRSVTELSVRATYRYLERATELAASGVEVISLGIGQPDFSPPGYVIDALKEACDKGMFRYVSSQGTESFKRAVSEFLKCELGVDVKPDEVLAVPGASAGIFMGLYALLNPGDEVIVLDPAFPQYFDVVKVLGGRVVPVKLRELSDEFVVDIDNVVSAITDRTKVIILNTPHNPTGMVIPESTMMKLLDVAREHGIIVLSDEVYDHFVYEGKHTSCLHHPEWRDFCIYVNSLSKTFAMTGWRVGFVVARREVIQKLSALANNIYSCLPPFIMYAAEVALRSGLDWFKEVLREYRRRRDLALSELRKVSGIRCVRPRGAFYLYPNLSDILSELGLSIGDFVELLIVKKGVVTLPSTVFSIAGDVEHIRMSFTVPVEKLLSGLARFKDFIDELRSMRGRVK